MNLVTLTDGAVEVEVLPEVGARLHRLRVFGHDVLRTPEDPGDHARDPFFWGSYVMAPWCNRIEPGPVAVGSRQVAVGANFPDGSAIHGQVYARPWEVQGEGTFAVRGGGDGWPWEYEVRQRIGVTAAALGPNDGLLRLDHELTNLSVDPMPAGLGIHPWFLRPLRIAIRGERVFPRNVATEPQPVPVSGPLDLREMQDVPDDLDGTWTDLGDPPVQLHWRDAGIRATMRITVPSLYIVAASPSHVDAVGVEPQTHAPQGMRRLLEGQSGSMVLLEPDQTLSLAVELAFERIDDDHGAA